MPLTWTDLPILSQFLWSVKDNTGSPVMPQDGQATQPKHKEQVENPRPQDLPKGVVLGKDGKP